MKHIIVFETKEILILKNLLKMDIKTLKIIQANADDIYTERLAKMIAEKDKKLLQRLEEAVLLEKT